MLKFRTPVAKAVVAAGAKLKMKEQDTRRIAIATAHLEHAGGSAVGVDILFRHIVTPMILAVVVVVVLIVRVAGGVET